METIRHTKDDLENKIDSFKNNTRSIRDRIFLSEHSMEEKMETNKREYLAQLEEVRAVAERGNRPTGACASAAQPPKFDGTTSWEVFQRQFETVAEHNCWMHREKLTYLITALKGRAADVLHTIPTSATYEETLQALEDRFREQHFAAAYHSQLKTRTQRAGESVQEFAMAIEQLVHRAYPTLPEDHIKRGRQGIRRRGRRPGYQNAAVTRRREDGKRGPQTGSRIKGRSPNRQATQNENQDILGEPIAPHPAKGRKAIGVLELWRARPLRE
jgi:hypothetical protein